MNQKVLRPEAPNKKINCRDEFELCYLRHQYIRRTDFNPTNEEMKPYAKIVQRLGNNTFYTYKGLFHLVGLGLDDVTNIGMVHLVSFLGLFSLERMPERYKQFCDSYYKKNRGTPTILDEHNKNMADCTLFLKQRMEDLVRICRQKARNIKGLPAEEYHVFYGPQKPPVVFHDLVENHRQLGFKKMDISVFKTIKKKIAPRPKGLAPFKHEGMWYVCVPIEQRMLNQIDFDCADMNPYDSLHNQTPEQILFSIEEDKRWQKQQELFDNKPAKEKVKILLRFVRKNVNNPKFEEEVKTALATIESLEQL